MKASSDAGLCAGCLHGRSIDSARGSRFWLCGRAASDGRYPKYPRLPMLQCPGFAPANAASG
ncbi:MAG: hypothetical protein OEZ06_27705 [Myxococcales bacterium]|nr:hypothetical protein [Myxococcales bacterium]